jgi:uncharacterized membrane protein YtjA (UPF0391 family)
MLSLALAFFIVAVIAAVFGFADPGATALNAGQVTFYVFLALFLLSFVAALRRKSLAGAQSM